MLRDVLIGMAYGAAIGCFNTWLLFKSVDRSRKRGEEIMKGIGRVLWIRLIVIALALMTVMRWPVIAVTTASSDIIIGFIAVMIWYKRKGGVIE
jgi:hypothetical protein